MHSGKTGAEELSESLLSGGSLFATGFCRLPIFLPAPSFGKGGAGSLVSGRRETKISNLSDCLFLCQWRIRFVNLYSENPYYQGDKYVKSRVVTPQ